MRRSTITFDLHQVRCLPVPQHSVQTQLDFTQAAVTDTPATINGKRSIWLRGLVMILMAIAFHISTTLLALVAIVQFMLALVSDTPNARLIAFGQSRDSVRTALSRAKCVSRARLTTSRLTTY